MTVLGYTEVSDSRRVIEIEIPADEVEKTRATITQSFARRASVPGFRKGKTPETVVARRFADAIREELLDRLVPEALTEAIREKGIEPLGRPRIENLRLESGAPLAFTANVDIRPPVEPGPYRELEIEDVPIEPTEEEIGQALAGLLESHAEFVPIEGRPARTGDYAIADVAYRVVEPGAPILYTGSGAAIAGESAAPWHKDEKLTIEIGHSDNMAEINNALDAAEPGSKRSFRKTFPPDFPNERFRGQTVDYEVMLAALKEKRLPAADDEFARHLGKVADLADLRAKIGDRIRSEKAGARRSRFRRQLLEQIVSQGRIPAPEVLIDAEVETALEEYATYLSSRNVDPKQADWDKLARDARPGAERRVREYLALDEISRREGISATDTEVDAEIRASADRRGLDFLDLRDRLEKQGRISSLRQELRLNKAVDWLIENARIRPAGGKDEIK